METYILKSSACLLALFLFYKLLLEKESAHKLKRYYLLMSVFVSFIIPLISYTTYTEITASSLNIIENLTEIEKNTITNNNFFSLSAILWTIYGLITFIIGFNFIKNLYQILKKVKNNPKESDTQTTNVLLQEVTIPHTFLKYIFVNKFDYLNGKIPESVLLHEKSHAQQKHSLDVIFIEFLQVIFWFNPLIYFYKKSIKLNHEFLADEAVLNNGFHPKTYQQILLAYSSHAPQLALANAINYSSIKKRFTVMKTQTSKKTIWLRSLILLPMLALLLFSFVKHETIYITPKENNFQKDTQEKATKKMVAEYNKLAKKYNQKQINKYHYKEVERLTYIYKIMTPSQKKSAEPYPNFPPPPPPPTPKVSKAESKPYPPYPADANCFINDKEASMREVKKIASKDIQSVFIRANDKSGNKLKKPTLHIFTNDYRGVVAPKPPKTPVVKETKLPPPPPPPFPKNADFFINGKKVSLNDVNSLDYKKIQTVDIMKLDKDGKEAKNPTVYIITKGFNKNK